MGQPQGLLWKSEPRTLLKHQVYRGYLGCWMGKLCQRFNYAAIVDAFAGPGEYLDGPDGSSIVIAKTFLEHSRRDRFNTLRLVCSEKRQDRRDHLAGLLAALPKTPKLVSNVLPPGTALDRLDELNFAAHGNDSGIPALWILDPFDINSLPLDLVRRCLAQTRDEVLITWFADEIYRFCGDPNKHEALNRHFGGANWKEALKVEGESARKAKLQRIYRDSLESLGSVYTEAFSISSKNEAARYSIVFATHNPAGLQCFNQVKWRMDNYKGEVVNEFRGTEQLDIFGGEEPLVDRLREWLESLKGQKKSLHELTEQTFRLGFKKTHLRNVLTAMAGDGMAVRESPLESRSPWPDESIVRFYGSSD
ncbi:three-Cys-motif partner protein TcmP [Spirillospora sp. NPDC029432]|uniref:three-Cys-motif partner protein TcmP n=1 Tax=Spirillospora sp. NPDC029432 TaxID=3154599 RepID=UPI0034562B95